MKYPYFLEFRIILQNRHTPELGCSNMFGWQCFVVLPKGGVFHWSEQEIIGQHSSINFPKVGLSFGAFTYIFGWNISTHLLSAYKSSSTDLLKSRGMGNCGSIRDSTNLTRSIKNLVRVLESSLQDLIRACLSEWTESQNHGLIQNYGWLLISKDQQKNFRLQKEEEWRYFGHIGI